MFKKIKMLAVGALSLLGVASVNAYAVLPTSVAASVTGIQSDGQAIFDLVFPVVAAFVGLGVVISLFKRFANKV